MADNTQVNTGSGGDIIRDIDRAGTKTQVVALDAGGQAAETLVSLTAPLPIQPAACYFIAGTGNSSTTQLGAGAAFVGTVENTLSQPAISLLITSDQPLLLTLNQYIDSGGLSKCAGWEFQIPGGSQFARSFTLNANYFNLSVVNVGMTATTTLNINTYYGTIEPAGQSPSQGSVPVVMASDQSPIPITGSVNADTGVLAAIAHVQARCQAAMLAVAFTRAQYGDGFVPLEIPEFLMGV